MNYIILIFLALVSYYVFTFAKHSWDKKNKTAAVGLTILALATFFFPGVILILRW